MQYDIRASSQIVFEHLQMGQEVQGSLSLHADQADLQYHGIQPDPEDLKAHQVPKES